MKISGFTIIRNAEIMGYPLIESIKSLLPLVDEMVIGLGPSTDNTEKWLNDLNSEKVKIFHTNWNVEVPSGGYILSEKTNEALDKCSYEWCFYLQADEVIHEADLKNIKDQMIKYNDDPEVEGLLFDYIHFYGSYSVVAKNKYWYRKEIRAFKKSCLARSYKDAQGFRKADGTKLRVVPAQARVFHYGYVKPPKKMGEKIKLFSRLWHGNKRDEMYSNFQYEKRFGLTPYSDSHPQVMQDLVKSQSWTYDSQLKWYEWSLRDVNLFANFLFEKIFCFRIGEYKPYKLLKSK